VRNAPTSLDARLALVRSLLAVGDVNRSAKEIDALLAAHPNVAAAHTQQGVLAAMRNDAQGARSAFARALELEPSSLEALAGLLALDRRAGQLARAEARIQERLSTGNPSPELLLLAARTYESADNFTGAESALRRALALQPSLLSAYAMLGRLYLAQGRLDKALAEFDGLAAKESRPVASLTMAGMILQAQGNAAAARNRYERAVEIDPRAAIAANNLAWLYLETAEKPDVALRLAQAAAESLPDAPEVLDTLGWAYLKNDKPTLALRTLARCVEQKPDAAGCHFRFGLASVEVGDVESGREALTRALQLKPEAAWVPDARRALAELTADAGA
jgi:tetratricopeptide (TPR) repeat protein